MKHALRECLMPTLVVAIVATVWAMGWSKELEMKARDVSKKRPETSIMLIDDGPSASNVVPVNAAPGAVAASDPQ